MKWRLRLVALFTATAIGTSCGTADSPGETSEGDTSVAATGILLRSDKGWELCPPEMLSGDGSGGCLNPVRLEIPESVTVPETLVTSAATVRGNLTDSTIAVVSIDSATLGSEPTPPSMDCEDSAISPGFAPGDDTAMPQWYRDAADTYGASHPEQYLGTWPNDDHLVIAFAGDTQVHTEQLAALVPGPYCVISVERTAAELERNIEQAYAAIASEPGEAILTSYVAASRESAAVYLLYGRPETVARLRTIVGDHLLISSFVKWE